MRWWDCLGHAHVHDTVGIVQGVQHSKSRRVDHITIIASTPSSRSSSLCIFLVSPQTCIPILDRYSEELSANMPCQAYKSFHSIQLYCFSNPVSDACGSAASSACLTLSAAFSKQTATQTPNLKQGIFPSHVHRSSSRKKASASIHPIEGGSFVEKMVGSQPPPACCHARHMITTLYRACSRGALGE